ncbi:MAG: M23 family metallopeptidase [Armatimonadetes bacterium]|nr:M23 family metallopeptidase [Armatimonadota bacterium]
MALSVTGVSRAAAPLARVHPGGLWVLAVPTQGADSARVTVFGETHAMYAHNGKWVAPIAVYARTKPGRYTATIRLDDRPALRVPLQVVAKKFPTQHIKMKKSKTGLMSPAILKKERQILNAAYEETHPEPMWRGAFQSPIPGARVSSDFGRTRYVNGKFWSQHGGIDLAAPQGKVTVAGNDGRVILAQKLWMRGNTLAIDHGMGIITVYNHLSSFLVKEGDTVRKGQPVGKVGATGFVTGPHLHWEIRAGGTPTNPWPILKGGIPLP